MAKIVAETAEVNARILYWGIDGAGKRTSLRIVSTKLRPDNRGELTETPTRFDPSVSYTVLPIELGNIGGMRTRIELIAVPGGPSHVPTRKQLLDQVDGVVLMIDAQEGRGEENAAIVDELRKSLGDYARRLEDLPLVVQYNKRDLADAYMIDELHRRLALGAANVFETVATESKGVLETLSSISKKVIRVLREQSIGSHRSLPAPPSEPPAAPALETPTPPAPAEIAPPIEPEPAAIETQPMPIEPELAAIETQPMPAELESAAIETQPMPVEPELSPAAELEEAILAESDAPDAASAEAEAARSILDQPWHDPDDLLEPALGPRLGPGLSIVSVGQATRADDRTVRVPVVLGDTDGEISTLVLSIRLDPLVDETH